MCSWKQRFCVTVGNARTGNVLSDNADFSHFSCCDTGNEDAGDGGEEGEMGDGSGGAAVGTERVVEGVVLGVDEGLLGGIGGRG